MLGEYLQKSYFFFLFLFDSNSTKEQKGFILQNLSKYQLQSIIEILYNLFKNKNIKYSTSLKKVISQNQFLFNKVLISKRQSVQRKFIQKHYRLIYLVLSKAKGIILQILEP